MSGLRSRKMVCLLVCQAMALAGLWAVNVGLDVPCGAQAESGWRDGTRLSDLGDESIEPQVAANGSNVHVVWADNRDGNYEIYYKRSTDNGVTWGPETSLTSTASDQKYPKIAVWGNDVHVVWKDGYINSTDNGDSWGGVSNPFSGLDTIVGPDIGVYQDKVYVTVANSTYFPFPVDDTYYYVVFKELSWADWIILDDGFSMGMGDYIAEIALTVKVDDIHIVYGNCFWSATPRSYYHIYSETGGLPGSWSPPDQFITGMQKAGISISFDETIVRISWSEWGEDIGVYEKIWDGVWSPRTYLGGDYGYTSVSGYYITWANPDFYPFLESNIEGRILELSNHTIYEPFHDVYLENENIHLVYYNEYEIYYLHKNGTELNLISDDITFDPLSPITNGTEVSISAKIYNGGPTTGKDVTVKFYNGNPDVDSDLIPDVTAMEIGMKEIDVDRYSWNIVSLNWIPPSPGLYDVYVWADPDNITHDYNFTNNLANNTLEVISETFYYELLEGWNLISIPLELSNNDITSVLQSIDNKYDAVQWFNSTDSNDHWKNYHVAKPSQLNDLDTVDRYKGIWLHITEPSGTTLTINDNNISTPQTINLHRGWNLVGYPSTSDRIRADALNNLTFDKEVDSIWTYNAFTQNWEEIGDTDYFELGKGYWIHAKKQCVWEVPL